ncbi:MAG: hypothetical protein LUC45_08250 [Paraprevotella sp.]|nr:hypothetical protein [Paraprevotella sp.]
MKEKFYANLKTTSFDFMGGSDEHIWNGMAQRETDETGIGTYYRLDGIEIGKEKPTTPDIYILRQTDGRTEKVSIGK